MQASKDQEFLQRLSDLTKDKELRQFITQLFRGIPHYDLNNVDENWLFAGAQSIWKLLRMSKRSARVTILRDEERPDEMILEVLHPDVPFLMDSISNVLKEDNFDLQLIVHPVLNVRRDKDGTFISATYDEQPDSSQEAILLFYISKWCEDEQCSQLEHRIYEVLECVDMSVQDWLPMRKQMSKITKEIHEPKKGTEAKLLYNETKEFLGWLEAKNFIFLGYFESVREGDKLQPIKESIKGLLRSKLYPIEPVDIDIQYTDKELMVIRKWDHRSVVHRYTHMDWLVVKKFDDKGNCVGAYNFLGLFTSAVYYQSVLTIPLIRVKANNVVRRYGHAETSHNAKELVTALEAFPRGELLQMSEDELFETGSGIVSLLLTPRVRLFLRQDKAEKFISCIIFLPRNRFSTDVRVQIEKMLCNSLNGVLSKQYVQISESPLARVHLLIQTVPHHIPQYDVEKLEEQIKTLVSVWSDNLYELLLQKSTKQVAKEQYKRFYNAFDIKYTSTFSAKQAVHDIGLIERAIAENQVQFDIYITPHAIGGTDSIQLKIYSPEQPLLLSVMLPKIENAGFKAFDVINYEIKLNGEKKIVYLSHFRLLPASNVDLLHSNLKEKIETAFYKIWENVIEDDRFNSLILCASLSWREALLLRVYAKYLKQINFPHDLNYVVEVLIKYHGITLQLVELFNSRFDVKNHKAPEQIENILHCISKDLSAVESIAEEQVLQAYMSIIMATKRTNFFQYTKNGLHKPYISLKISSNEVIGMPEPKPYAETYVYCPTRFEGIHLRGSRIARGGLRWSDRPDFRTEVLGLMKAQMTKNAVIVPSGSKGGFLLKNVSPIDGREAFLKEGVECYKMFLSGLLDITDNVLEDKVVPPKNVIRYDEDDPYLVVAADKGTATFSDYANSISSEHKFWLGDAFASGGSVGYDHKKMGITARGAWISVKHHFAALGIDINNTPFTVVGIGDMSGDVFGNGMLLSKQINLIGAFNHMHIFLDPHPIPEQSYNERYRLFHLPRSQWSDYDQKLISKGGGIFERSSKYIDLSPEMAAVLEIEPGKITPENLLRALLKAPVALLWNGGIGTYVKAESELNSHIGDKANDALRVNGKELRCKVIGEGGNLGMTQLGRIEYAHHAGRLNTDFIDNSAGVDCSDHEVNIKIALNRIMQSGALTLEERNKLLDTMTETVAKLVLNDNYMQNRLIACEEMSGDRRISVHAWLIRYLENRDELDRGLEFLPSAEAMVVLESEEKCLTRPELAVLVAYAKNSAFQILSSCQLNNDPYLQTDLLAYFPHELKEKYAATLLQHQLSNEILVTVLVNEFINMLGCSAFHQLVDGGYNPELIIKAYVTIRDLFGMPAYWEKIHSLDSQVGFDVQVQVMWEMQRVMIRNIRWLLRHHSNDLDNIEACIDLYSSKLLKIHKMCVDDLYSCSYNLDHHAEVLANVPFSLRHMMSELHNMYQALDIIQIASTTKSDIASVIAAYKALGQKMHIDWLLMQTRRYHVMEYIDKVALQSIVSEIEDLHGQLTAQSLADTTDKAYCAVLDSVKLEEYSRFIGEMKVNSSAWIGMLVLTVQRIREFLCS